MEHVASEHFWSSDRILLAVIFIIGIVAGAFITNQYIDPYLNSSNSSDYNALLQENNRLDKRGDQLFLCLEKNNIDPKNCTAKVLE